LLLPFTLLILVPGCARQSNFVEGSGTIEMDEVEVASLVGGRLLRLLVNEGDRVEAGDTLVYLGHGEIAGEIQSRTAETDRAEALWRDQERGPREAERKTARADLDAAETSLGLLNAELRRIEALQKQNLAADADVDRARAARDEAAARRAVADERLALVEEGYRRDQVAAARKAVDAAKGNLLSSMAKGRELVLTAPIHGVVLFKNVQRGEVVAPGTSILTLGNPDSLWMRCYLSTPEVARIRLGGRAQVHVLGWEKRGFPGRVTEIATRAEFTPRSALTEEERASVVFGVKIALDPTNGILKPGLPADARIETVAP
jgi:membrane fusion protein YbhG